MSQILNLDGGVRSKKRLEVQLGEDRFKFPPQ